MRQEVKIKLEKDLKDFFDSQRGNLRSWFEKVGKAASRRFWAMLCSDLMRLKPKEISAYFQDPRLKLAEAESFWAELASKFFNPTHPAEELRAYQEALIYACLELEAASHLKQLEASTDSKALLQEKLQLWEAP
ncbi:MAG: hypothetical protein AB1491_01275 [Thermodesulfobacteriota bacterium]